jgi:hypothetical protein
MKYGNRVQDTSTSVGTGNFILAGAALATFFPFTTLGGSSPITVGDTFPYSIVNTNQAESGTGTVVSLLPFTFSRSPDFGASPINFNAGTKMVFSDVSAALTLSLADGITLSALPSAPALTSSANIAVNIAGTDYITSLGALATYLGAPDNSAPVFVSAQVANASPSVIVLTFNETLGAFTPAAAAFTVSGGKTVSSVARSGATISLTVNSPYAAGAAITATYVKPGSNAIQDGVGNQTNGFGPVAVTNNVASTDTTPPTVLSAAVANATPTVVNLTMSETIDPSNIPVASSFTVAGHTVSSIAVSGSTINLTCSVAFVNGEAARTVAYTAPGTANIRDLATPANQLVNFSAQAITNNVAASSAPVYELRTASSNGLPNAGHWFPDTPLTATTSGGQYFAQPDGIRCEVYVKTAAGVPASAIKTCWSKSPTVAPINFNSTSDPITAHANGVDAGYRVTSWVNPGDSYYGMYSVNPVIWNVSGNKVAGEKWYLWVATADGYVAPIDDGTGVPLFVTVA